MTRRRISYAAAVVAVLIVGFVAGAWWQSSRPPADEPVLGTVDIGFAQDMAVHHQQAITLCDNVIGRVDGQVSALCQQIRDTQQREIGAMLGWLQLLGLPAGSAAPMTWMPDGHAGHGATGQKPPMPGMASWQEIDELRNRTGKDAETRLLQLMIRHHQGGIDMANHAATHGNNPRVIQFAGEISGAQTQEIAVMSQLLTARDADALPYP